MNIKIRSLIKEFKLEVLVEGEESTGIIVSDINRPGLQFAGFYNYFANERIQIIGKAEWSFLESMDIELRNSRLRKFFEKRTPCIIIARGLEPQPELIKLAQEKKRWLLRTDLLTTRFINKYMNYVDNVLAPETRMHGVLVDVYGIGILITGESGMGKSETALELIKRGHRLIADDAVDIKVIDGTLYGSAPYITNGMMELRGLGIIDVPALYGLSSIQKVKTIDLVANLQLWDENTEFDRLGIDDEYINILNKDVKKVSIPIRPGRNIAIIIEAIAANYRYGLFSKITPAETINKRMEEIDNDDR